MMHRNQEHTADVVAVFSVNIYLTEDLLKVEFLHFCFLHDVSEMFNFFH